MLKMNDGVIDARVGQADINARVQYVDAII